MQYEVVPTDEVQKSRNLDSSFSSNWIYAHKIKSWLRPVEQVEGARWVKASEVKDLPMEKFMPIKDNVGCYRLGNFFKNEGNMTVFSVIGTEMYGTFIMTDLDHIYILDESHQPSEGQGEDAYIPVVAIKDGDGHWYVIPKELEELFRKMEEEGEADSYCSFMGKFDEYKTGGDLNNIQLFKRKLLTNDKGRKINRIFG